MPATVPAYLTVPLRVSPRRMSAAEHAKFGPWVLRNMFGASHLTFAPSKAARRPPPTVEEGDSAVRQPRDDEYEFLLETPMRARRSKLRKPFDDLPEGILDLIQRTPVLAMVDEDEDGSGSGPIPLDLDVDGEEDEDELLLKPGAAVS